MNTSDLLLGSFRAERRVPEIQASCTVGRTTILIVGSTICITSSPIQASWRWPGSGSRGTRAHARPEWTG